MGRRPRAGRPRARPTRRRPPPSPPGRNELLASHPHLRGNRARGEGGGDMSSRSRRAGLTRRDFCALGGAAAGGLLLQRPARTIGDHALFRFGRLALPGLPDPRPTALRRLAWDLVRRTSLVTASEPTALRLADPALFRFPFLVLSGDRGFTLPPEADLARLRRHITYGGFL